MKSSMLADGDQGEKFVRPLNLQWQKGSVIQRGLQLNQYLSTLIMYMVL